MRTLSGVWRLATTFVLSFAVLAGCSTPPTSPAASPTLSGSVDRETLRRSVEDEIAYGPPRRRNIQSVIVQVDGVTELEQYWNFDAERYQNVFSVTKSILSTLVGIALSEGILTSLDQKLATLLPEYRRLMSKEVASITLEQLLTMTSGIGEGTDLHQQEIGAKDYIAEVLRAGTVAEPGTQWIYSDPSANVLAAVLSEALKRHDGDQPRSLLDYGREKLFDPLGVDSEPAYTGFEANYPFSRSFEEAGFGWATDRMGRFYGDSMIRLRARDMASVGQLYLDGGRWNGQQLVPEAWVREATNRIELARYGRLWWDVDAGIHPAFAAIGLGGQLVLVVPELRLVVAIQSRLDPEDALLAQDRISLVETAILPHIE
jgi:CubicO group peptidase (beta-lactamase class C family)